MKLVSTEVDGAYVVVPEPQLDERGSFVRTFDVATFAAAGFPVDVAVSAISTNTRRGTLRGLHLQTPPHADAKLVRCVRGRIFDVAVDLRPDSPTYLAWTGHELRAEEHTALAIPEGCAHGFLTLEDDSWIAYQLSAEHAPAAALGIRWDDPTVGIRWPEEPVVISDRDKALPFVSEAVA